MPVVVKAYGLSDASEKQLKKLRALIKSELCRVVELQLVPKAVSIFFLKDEATATDEGVVLEIDGLDRKPERTPELLAAVAVNLSERIRDRIRKLGRRFRQSLVVIVFIYPYNPAKGGFAKAEI